MPSDEDLKKQAEEWKAKGNDAFQKGLFDDAVKAYSQGIVACDRLVLSLTIVANLKAPLLSNRAACYLKMMKYQLCIDDCSTALQLDPIDAKLRGKILYRRAKARFLLSNLPGGTAGAGAGATTSADDFRQDAAKDLLQLLSFDPKNTDANQLLLAVRAQHKMNEQTGKARTTPVGKTIAALEARKDIHHNLKVLAGLLDNDLSNAAMEFGRLGGVQLMFDIATEEAEASAANGSADKKSSAVLAVQAVSHAASHPPFVRAYLRNVQSELLELTKRYNGSGSNFVNPDVLVSLLAVLDRIVLHLDRDDPNKDIDGQTGLNYAALVETCNAALRSSDKTVIRAVLDVLTVWCAGLERDASIRASLGGSIDPLLPSPVTPAQERAMTPQECAAYRKRKYEKRTRDEAWAYERGIYFVSDPSTAGLQTLLDAANACDDHVVRREVTVVVGRILANVGGDNNDGDDKVKEIVQPYLQKKKGENDGMGVVIEEVYNEDEEEQKQAALKEEQDATVPLETMMSRAIITCALLLSKKEIGAWAFGPGWTDSVEEIQAMIDSGDSRAMCLASEVVSAAATLESAAPVISGLITGGYMEKLIKSGDRDIRSGAASAVAKVGLANKSTKTDEGEKMSMLQGACDLLEDRGDKESGVDKDHKGTAKLHHFSSFATSSVERAIEMIQFLVADTFIKEELAAGFQAPDSKHTALERLVEVANIPNAGESLSGFGLATIFQHLAVTNLQLRKEMFEGKEVTMEQYDEMQRMGKTEEEKELMDLEADTDTQSSCNERIRKMASVNVPRAIVTLMDGASEHTMEQLVLAMNRMAGEPAVRGILIQQGILSACIKTEKNESPTETDTMVKVIRLSRHTIAKLLVTTNPSLLTSAQRLGSVRPLLQLVRDIRASDLQHFEALLALTNIASSGDDAKSRIVSEKGIAPLNFAMFSDHEMVQQAATECMCNLVGNPAMMEHLAVPDNLKLWLAFASDYEARYECARAAAGCLAMATQDLTIALALVSLEKFGDSMRSILECGRLEIMHRAFYIILNLMVHGGDCREQAVKETLPAFCEAYVASYHNGEVMEELNFSPEEQALLPATLDVAKKIVAISDSPEGS